MRTSKAGYSESKTNHIRVVHARGVNSGTSMEDWGISASTDEIQNLYIFNSLPD